MQGKQLIVRGVRKLGRVVMGEAPAKPGGSGGGGGGSGGGKPAMSGYHIAMQALSSKCNPLVIVQVGANDGRINDPIHGFVKRRAEDTRLVLIEPQTQILPYLRESYAFHKNHHIVNCAVGQQDSLTLHIVDPKIWDQLSVLYAEDWPSYRAPTGVTSAHRADVVRWLTKFVPHDVDADAHVLELTVPCKTLPQLLKGEGLEVRADVLQIDAEGFDDEVIYASDIAKLQPSIIFFEAHRMRQTDAGRKRLDALRKHLKFYNYTLVPQKGDIMAILNGPMEH